MNTAQEHSQPSSRFLVYWQQAGHQLFAFTTAIEAASPQAARASAGKAVARSGRILGVKQSAGSGLRTLNRGRWVG